MAYSSFPFFFLSFNQTFPRILENRKCFYRIVFSRNLQINLLPEFFSLFSNTFSGLTFNSCFTKLYRDTVHYIDSFISTVMHYIVHIEYITSMYTMYRYVRYYHCYLAECHGALYHFITADYTPLSTDLLPLSNWLPCQSLSDSLISICVTFTHVCNLIIHLLVYINPFCRQIFGHWFSGLNPTSCHPHLKLTLVPEGTEKCSAKTLMHTSGVLQQHNAIISISASELFTDEAMFAPKRVHMITRSSRLCKSWNQHMPDDMYKVRYDRKFWYTCETKITSRNRLAIEYRQKRMKPENDP